MGNHSSSESGPTQQDYKAFVDDLLEMQKFLNEKFVAGHLRSSVTEDEFDSEYLDALKIKLRQLQNVRRHVRSQRGRSAQNVPTTLMRLLDALEPQCQKAIDELTRLQDHHRQSPSASSSQVDPVGLLDLTADDDSPSDVDPSTVYGDDDDDDDKQTETSDEDDINSNSSATASFGDSKNYATVSDWVERVVEDSDAHYTKWKVDRKASDFLESVFTEYEKVRERAFRRPLEITFEGEPGVDAGGLTKEFFHLAFEAVLSRTYKDCPMFEGKRGNLIPSSSAEHLVNGYKYIGMMIVHAAMNGCRGLPGLSPAIQQYIVHGEGPATIEDVAYLVDIDDVADTGLKHLLIKLNDSDTLTDADNELLMTWMERCNCRVMFSENTRQLISQTILIYYVFHSRIVQIEAISKGMDMFEFREFLHHNPSEDNRMFVFPSDDDVEVTPEMLTAVSVFGMTSSTTSTIHEETFDFFQLFLHELYGGQIANKKLSDLIQFVSGTPYLPAQLVLTFSEEIVYPVAHACFNQLDLPARHQDYASFRDAITFALQHGTAFTTE